MTTWTGRVDLQTDNIVSGSLQSFVTSGGGLLGWTLSSEAPRTRPPTANAEHALASLAVNVYAMQEVTRKQLRGYGGLLARKAAYNIIQAYEILLKSRRSENGTFSGEGGTGECPGSMKTGPKENWS